MEKVKPKLGRPPIQDEHTGQGNAYTRWWNRNRKQPGVCQRCGHAVPETETRNSWLSGKVVKVLKKVCNSCVEKQVRMRLYGKEMS